MMGDSTNLCDMKYDIVLLGAPTVGKSAIVEQFTKGRLLHAEYKPTIGIDFVGRSVSYQSKVLRLKLWDAAGDEKYRSLLRAYVSRADCGVIVYDVANPQSLHECDRWLTFFRQHQRSDAVVVIVANKSDLPTAIPANLLSSWVTLKGINTCSVSAQNGQGIEALFEAIIHNINLVQEDPFQNTPSINSQKSNTISTQASINKSQKNIDIRDYKDKRCCKVS